MKHEVKQLIIDLLTIRQKFSDDVFNQAVEFIKSGNFLDVLIMTSKIEPPMVSEALSPNRRVRRSRLSADHLGFLREQNIVFKEGLVIPSKTLKVFADLIRNENQISQALLKSLKAKITNEFRENHLSERKITGIRDILLVITNSKDPKQINFYASLIKAELSQPNNSSLTDWANIISPKGSKDSGEDGD